MSGHAKLAVRAWADGGGWKKARWYSRTHLHPLRILYSHPFHLRPALFSLYLFIRRYTWAAGDRWADDGSDVIDSRLMDGRRADTGLMCCGGHGRPAEGLLIDR